MFLMLFSDADKEPANNLTKLAVTDVDYLLSKTKGISKGVIYNVSVSAKGMGARFLGCSTRGYYAWELFTGVTFQNYLNFISSIFVFMESNYPYQAISNSSTLILTYHLFSFTSRV